jgi:iron complex outermembrane receptor protein
VGAGAADWKLSPKAILKGDFEYQHKVKRDGSGYQLLGGTTLPDINAIYPSTMLGDQPWGPPDTYDTFNTGARLDYTLPHNWLAFCRGELISHSLIQDNVIYAYGTPFDANGNVDCPNAPDAPAYFFCPDGTYGIYDYRDPGELRIDAVAEAMLTGHVKTGAISQDLAAGGEAFSAACNSPEHRLRMLLPRDSAGWRGLQLRGFGEHLSTHRAGLPIESPLESAGPRGTLWEDNHQSAYCAGQDSSARAHSTDRRRPIRFSARPTTTRSPQLVRLRRQRLPTNCSGCRNTQRLTIPSIA